MKIFKDRQSAGKLLVKRLENVKTDLILGIPRGGVVVAFEVAKLLKLPLDIIITRKIGAPGQEELALGAVDPDGEVVWDDELLSQLNPPADGLKFKIEEEMKEIKRRERMYRQGRAPLNVENKAIILIDDGMATGATVLSALKYLKRHKARVTLAIPVVRQEALDKVKNEIDKYVVLEIPQYFQAVGQFYQHFEPVSDEEVIQYLT